MGAGALRLDRRGENDAARLLIKRGISARVGAFGAASRVRGLDIEAHPRLNPRTDRWGCLTGCNGLAGGGKYDVNELL